MIDITGEWVDIDAVMLRMSSVEGFLNRRLMEGMKDALETYAASLKSVELSGGVLQRRSGNLANSIVTRVREKGTRVTGITYFKAKYGYMLSAGTPKNEVMVFFDGKRVKRVIAYSLRTRKARAAKWVREGRINFIRKMIGAKIPKPFIAPAYARMKPAIYARLRLSVEQAMADARGSA